jgi:hypothetical protein
MLAALALPWLTAVAAAGSFDGVYKGTQRATQTNNSADCLQLNHDNVVLRIQDNHFTRTWRAELQVDVAPDGSFAASTVIGQRPFRTANIKGKISGADLEADIGTNLCSAHLSLKRS